MGGATPVGVVLGSMRRQAERSCHLDRLIAGVNFSMLVTFFFSPLLLLPSILCWDCKPVNGTPPWSPVSRFPLRFLSYPDFLPWFPSMMNKKEVIVDLEICDLEV